jgi:hypothetical protein
MAIGKNQRNRNPDNLPSLQLGKKKKEEENRDVGVK